MAEETSLQDRVLQSFGRFPNGHVHSTRMAGLLKVKPISVVSALRALERKGLVGRNPGRSKWEPYYWFRTRKTTEDKQC